jgi:hypothetical protein
VSNFNENPDLNFDPFNENGSSENTGDPFDIAGIGGDFFNLSEGTGDSLDLGGQSFGSEGGVSAGNPFLDDGFVGPQSPDYPQPVETEDSEESDEDVPEEPVKKKKGFWGGKSKKETPPKEEAEIDDDGNKVKVGKKQKEKVPTGGIVPKDLPTILCIAFTVFLLASLLVFNVVTFLYRGPSMMQTLCFMGAFNLVGLAVAAVPILFFKSPKEWWTLPNVMLGISVAALFSGVMVLVYEFYSYDFIVKP